MKNIRVLGLLAFVFVAVFAAGVNAQTPQTALEKQVFKKINGLPYYGVFDHIAFQVNGTTVTLTGKVASLGTSAAAERAVKRIPGVDVVVNEIDDLPPSSFDDSIRRQLIRSFARDGGNLSRYLQEPNPSIRIIVENGRVTLEGFVTYKADSSLANVLANGASNVFSVKNNLVVVNSR
jgi:hyperosmotically inducible protein